MSQKTFEDIFFIDSWPGQHTLSGEVSREAAYYYRVPDGVAVAVLTFKDNEPMIKDSPHLIVPVAQISSKVLNDNIAAMVTYLLEDRPAVPVFYEHLRNYRADKKLLNLMCHPSIDLPDGLSAIRNENFPDKLNAEVSIIYACEARSVDNIPAVIVRAANNGMGAFIFPDRFHKIRMEAPIMTALERVLDDPLGD